MRDDDFERLYAAEAAGRCSASSSTARATAALAEDLLADTFERALRSRKRYDRRRGPEKTWLYAIALNLLRDHGGGRRPRGGRYERATAAAASATTFADVEARDEPGAGAAALPPRSARRSRCASAPS